MRIIKDPLLWTREDELLLTREDSRFDLEVGDVVIVGGKRGKVMAETQDPMYPVKVLFEGDSRIVQPISWSIKRLGEI